MTETDEKKVRKPRQMRRRHTHTIIPVYLLFDPTITLAEAVFLAEIDALDGEDGCFAMNKHFSPIVRASDDHARKIISGLVKKGRIVRRVVPSSKGSKRYMVVAWSAATHPVYLPGGDPAYPPGGPSENTPPPPADPPGGNIDENTRESTGRERSSSLPPSFAELLQKIPPTKSGQLLRSRIVAKAFLPMGFTRWLIEQAVSRFEKKIDLSKTQLGDWAELFEKFGEDIFTKSIKRIMISDKTKGNLPSIGEVVEEAEKIKTEKAKAKRIPKPPEKTRSVAEKLAAMSKEELVKIIERTQKLPVSMQTFLGDYEKELKSRGLK